jgi:hypothetical protein
MHLPSHCSIHAHRTRSERGLVDMSRVRNALKIADVWQPRPSEPFEGRALPLARATLAPSQPIDPVTYEEPEIELEERSPVSAYLPKASLSFSARLLRRVKRWLRIRSGVVVPRCNGFTRTGLACRAPSMLNGYCRMHGGSRKLLG